MKKVFSILSLLAVVVLLSFSTVNERKRIVIDAGHGGHDHGATYEEHLEKEIVEKIAKKIGKNYDPSKVDVILLRDTDAFLSLQERTEKINAIMPDLVISLHINNSKNKDTKGVEAYVSENNTHFETSEKHAGALLSNLSTTRLPVGGVKKANFFVLTKVTAPSVVLELGYLSNADDRAYITSDTGQNELVERILETLETP